MSWIQRRQTILNKIVITLNQADKLNTKIPKNALIAEVCLEFGSSRKKVMEYIKILLDSKRVKETWDRKDTYLEINKLSVELDL